MVSFILGVLLLLTSGLGWLSYHRPDISLRILYGIFGLLVLLHIGFTLYSNGWLDAKSYIADSLPPKHADTTKAMTRLALSASTERIKSLQEQSRQIFYVAYAITIGLWLLSQIRRRYP